MRDTIAITLIAIIACLLIAYIGGRRPLPTREAYQHARGTIEDCMSDGTDYETCRVYVLKGEINGNE